MTEKPVGEDGRHYIKNNNEKNYLKNNKNIIYNKIIKYYL